MTLDVFKQSLAEPAPPPGLTPALEALWFDAKGDWETAHARAQEDEGRAGAWVHAYLHRKEGDASNAAYWYRRANQPVAAGPLETEWADVARALLSPADEPATRP